MNEILYFGCIDQPGHSLHSKLNPRISYYHQPWRNLDGGLLPPKDQREGQIVYERKDGWAVVSFWDRSADRRENSNSAFLAQAELNAVELLRAAREQWPEIFSRRMFPVLNCKV